MIFKTEKKVVDGWVFLSADFSLQASGKPNATGIVTLVRSPSEKKKWHNLPEEVKEDVNGPALYVIGHGLTFYDALDNANYKAMKENPISEVCDEIQN